MIIDIALTRYQPLSTSNLIVLIIAVLLRNSATVSSTLLTPTADYSCLGERVTFKCIVNNGERLHWNVEFSDPELATIRQRFLISDALGHPKFVNYTRVHTFEFNLTSNSPGALISTASTIAEQRLEGTRVSCRDMNSAQNTSVIHIIQSPINIGSILKTNEMPTGNQTVIVHMIVSANTVGEEYKYFVNVTPSVESGPASFTIENSSFQLSVLYNREYTVSVVANNCAGNGSLATTTFTISKKSSNVSQIDCGLPTLLKGAGILTESYTTTESSQITLICTEGLFFNTTIILTCTREGKWYPDPTKFSCLPERSDPNSNHNSKKQPLVGYIITGLSTSILFFALGVFCTISIHWCQLRQKRCTRSRVAGTTTGVAGTNNSTNVNVSQGGPQQQLSEPVYAECSMSISHEKLELNTDSNIAYQRPQVNNMYVSLDQN